MAMKIVLSLAVTAAILLHVQRVEATSRGSPFCDVNSPEGHAVPSSDRKLDASLSKVRIPGTDEWMVTLTRGPTQKVRGLMLREKEGRGTFLSPADPNFKTLTENTPRSKIQFQCITHANSNEKAQSLSFVFVPNDPSVTPKFFAIVVEKFDTWWTLEDSN